MVFTPLKAFADPPKNIIMEFNINPITGQPYNSPDSPKILKVKVVHPVKPNQQKHFISYIKVFLNKDLVVEQHFKSQSSDSAQEVCYSLIDAKIGDKILTEAKCSIYGTDKKELLISEPKQGEK